MSARVMNARVEVPRIHRGFPGTSVLAAVVIATVVGGLAGSAITRVLDERTASAPVTVGSTPWDVGKLQAMQGRQLAAEVNDSVPLWDAGKLQAMEGRQLAAGTTVEPASSLTRWNGAKLEAMQGSTPR
jgi:hypothetical protein